MKINYTFSNGNLPPLGLLDRDKKKSTCICMTKILLTTTNNMYVNPKK